MPEPEPNPKPELQIEAVKLQHSWGIWLVTVQLGLIAAVSSVVLDHSKFPHPVNSWSLITAVILSSASIIAASFLLSAHASIMLRLTPAMRDLNLKLWEVEYCPNALAIAIIEHWAFAAAIVFYTVFLVSQVV